MIEIRSALVNTNKVQNDNEHSAINKDNPFPIEDDINANNQVKNLDQAGKNEEAHINEKNINDPNIQKDIIDSERKNISEKKSFS